MDEDKRTNGRKKVIELLGYLKIKDGHCEKLHKALSESAYN